MQRLVGKDFARRKVFGDVVEATGLEEQRVARRKVVRESIVGVLLVCASELSLSYEKSLMRDVKKK